MGFFSRILGLDSTPEAKVSEAEQAEAELMQAMRQGYRETGIPLERERVAQTLGMQWNEGTQGYDRVGGKNSAIDANGNMNMHTVKTGAPVAGISQAYEQQRGHVNPNMQTGTDDVGDLAQAKDESQAVRQTAEGDVSNAYNSMRNAAGLAHGAQMQSANDMSQLASQQAEQANFNAGNKFARQSNNRALLGSAIGVGASAYQNGSFGKARLPYTQPDGTGVG